MSNNEILIPKMKRKERKLRLPLFNLLLIFIGVFTLIASTFVCINLKHYIIPIGTNGQYIKSLEYIPQIPALMFICSALGKRIAISSIIVYLLLGFTILPLFALGGNITYLAEFSAGYLLSYLPVVAICGNILSGKYTFKRMFFVSLFGVLSIHICGILYMILIAILKHEGIDFIKGWIIIQSFGKIIYDIIGSFVLVLIGKFIQETLHYLK